MSENRKNKEQKEELLHDTVEGQSKLPIIQIAEKWENVSTVSTNSIEKPIIKRFYCYVKSIFV